MKRQIEVNDVLQECIDSAIDDVRAELLRHCEENDPDALPDLGNDLDYSGAIHEIIDGAVPLYTHDIKAAMFLYGDDIEAAFDDAGIGEKTDGWHAAAIYCYIERAVNEWYAEHAEEVFDEWRAGRTTEESTS